MNPRALTNALLKDLTTWLSKHPECVALATKATGVDPWSPGFSCTHVALAAADGTAWVIDGANDTLLRETLRLLAGRRVWAHPAAFHRAAILSGYQMQLDLSDSRTLARMLRPQLGDFSLAALRPTTRLGDDRLDQVGVALKNDSAHRHLLPSVTTTPTPGDAVTDAIRCAQLVHSLRSDAEKYPSWPTEILTERWWSRAMNRGLLVDEPQLSAAEQRVEGVRLTVVEQLGLDVTRDSDEVREWLKSRGIAITTADGKPTLAAKRFDHAVVPSGSKAAWGCFTRARAESRVANALTAIRSAIEPDGRIHGVLDTLGAQTGRMTSSGPNLQNIQPALRGIFQADPGHILLAADFSSVEPRVMAVLSRDEGLIAAVQSSDIYTTMATAIWGTAAEGDKQKRKQAKTACLAISYGQGVTSLGAALGLAEDEARELLHQFQSQYPQLISWSHEVINNAKAGGWQKTLFDRPLPRPMDQPGDPRHFRAVNWIVQGTAADIFKMATARVVDALGPKALWLPIHDELVIQVPEAQRAQALDALQLMETKIGDVSIPVEAKVLGTHWAHL